MNRKVLLIGSSFSAAPLFFALKKRGYHVSVCGGYQQDPLHQYADASVYLNYADSGLLLEHIQSHSYDAMIPSCNDFGYLSAAVVAQQEGFDGFDDQFVTNVLHHKQSFRAFCQHNQIRVPKTFEFSDLEKLDKLPCTLIIKPVDSFSGKGVSVIHRSEQLISAVDQAKQVSRSSSFVIEEYIDGTLHSHSAFIHNGKIITEFFVDEFCTVYPYQVNCSSLSFLKESIRQAVSSEVQKLISSLDIVDGLLHTQFMVQNDNYWLIECMRRCPGDLYGKLVHLSTGFDYADAYIQPFLQAENIYEPFVQSEVVPFSRHTVSTEMSCYLESMESNIPSVQDILVPLKNSGEKLEPAPYDKLGIIFSRFKSQDELHAHTPILDRYIKINTY
jgi:phosphoribosylamine-glycine ligase